MRGMIEKLTDRLDLVIHTITSRPNANDITFEDALVLGQFYCDFQNTNCFIDEAEKRAHHDVSALLTSVTKLKALIGQFLSLELSVWRNVDFVTLEKEHLRPYTEQSDKAQSKANALWQKYQLESNHLDFLVFDSEEYQNLDAQCERTKQEYAMASSENNKVYSIFKEEQSKCARVHYFDMQFLELWAAKMAQITAAIINDAERLMKEGGV